MIVDLSDFERGTAVGGRQAETADLVGFSHTMISRVYRELSEKEKMSSEQRFSDWKCLVGVRGGFIVWKCFVLVEFLSVSVILFFFSVLLYGRLKLKAGFRKMIQSFRQAPNWKRLKWRIFCLYLYFILVHFPSSQTISVLFFKKKKLKKLF